MYSALARISRQTMLKRRADVNRQNGTGKTPLDMAFQANSGAIRKELEAAGGKYNIVRKQDRPAPLVRRFCRMAHPRSPVEIWTSYFAVGGGLASIPLDPNEYSWSGKLQCIATNLTAAFRTQVLVRCALGSLT